MDATTYVNESARTAAGEMHFNVLRLNQVPAFLEAFAYEGENLDVVKKALFYGKKPTENFRFFDYGYDDEPRSVEQDILHGILGVGTEAAEMVEMLREHMDGGAQIDRTKLISEMGDTLWYTAMLCRALNVTMEDVMAFNIEKLRKRFPDKFDAQRAINKNTTVEDTAGEEVMS